VSLDEVIDIYLPLSRLLNLHIGASQGLHGATGAFLGTQVSKAPYVIGLAGSVAVGKSTTARIMQALLARWPDHPKVDLVATDGFLHPRRVLDEQRIMHRKGFPESYDLRALVTFLSDVKSGQTEIAVPVYSHLTYDIVPGQFQIIDQPDVLIVEGLNILHAGDRLPRPPQHLFVSTSRKSPSAATGPRERCRAPSATSRCAGSKMPSPGSSSGYRVASGRAYGWSKKPQKPAQPAHGVDWLCRQLIGRTSGTVAE
jgi:uridine kinase